MDGGSRPRDSAADSVQNGGVSLLTPWRKRTYSGSGVRGDMATKLGGNEDNDTSANKADQDKKAMKISSAGTGPGPAAKKKLKQSRMKIGCKNRTQTKAREPRDEPSTMLDEASRAASSKSEERAAGEGGQAKSTFHAAAYRPHSRSPTKDDWAAQAVVHRVTCQAGLDGQSERTAGTDRNGGRSLRKPNCGSRKSRREKDDNW